MFKRGRGRESARADTRTKRNGDASVVLLNPRLWPTTAEHNIHASSVGPISRWRRRGRRRLRAFGRASERPATAPAGWTNYKRCWSRTPAVGSHLRGLHRHRVRSWLLWWRQICTLHANSVAVLHSYFCAARWDLHMENISNAHATGGRRSARLLAGRVYNCVGLRQGASSRQA